MAGVGVTIETFKEGANLAGRFVLHVKCYGVLNSVTKSITWLCIIFFIKYVTNLLLEQLIFSLPSVPIGGQPISAMSLQQSLLKWHIESQ